MSTTPTYHPIYPPRDFLENKPDSMKSLPKPTAQKNTLATYPIP